MQRMLVMAESQWVAQFCLQVSCDTVYTLYSTASYHDILYHIAINYITSL